MPRDHRLLFQSCSSQRQRRFGFITGTERHRSRVIEFNCLRSVADEPKRQGYRLIGLTLLTAWSSLCGKWRLRSWTNIIMKAASGKLVWNQHFRHVRHVCVVTYHIGGIDASSTLRNSWILSSIKHSIKKDKFSEKTRTRVTAHTRAKGILTWSSLKYGTAQRQHSGPGRHYTKTLGTSVASLLLLHWSYTALSLVFSTNVVCVKTQQIHCSIKHHDETKQ